MNKVMKLKTGYVGRNDLDGKYRHMNIKEAKKLNYGDVVCFLYNSGEVRQAKVNGKPKTWKTRPAHVEAPVKYGLYEYNRVCKYSDTILDTIEPILVKVN